MSDELKGVQKSIIGYMCYIDYVYELGNASDGNKVYPSEEALKKEHECWEECGIVEVDRQTRPEGGSTKMVLKFGSPASWFGRSMRNCGFC